MFEQLKYFLVYNIMENDAVALHNTSTDCWIIIKSKVYDITSYLDKHPGGSSLLLEFAGKDATDEFIQIGHSQNATKLLETYEIGELSKPVQPVQIVKRSWLQTIVDWIYPEPIDTRAQLIQRTQITHDTIHLTFFVHKIELKCGQHLICYNGEMHRKYTPIQASNNAFELIVKVYDVGGMSAYLNSLQIGDRLTVSEPVGNKIYCGNGVFSNLDNKVKRMIMICAGTGITPMYPILKKINESCENICVSVLYVNKTKNDVLLQDELDRICLESSNIKIQYSFTRLEDEVQSPLLQGRPTLEMIKGLGNCDLALICGPTGFNNSVDEICKELGHKTQIY